MLCSSLIDACKDVQTPITKHQKKKQSCDFHFNLSKTYISVAANTAVAPTDRLHATPAPSFPVHNEAQRLVVASWIRIKWNLSLAMNMARVPACLHLWENFYADIVKGMYHIMDSWSPHAGLLSIMVFNWFTDYYILHTLARFSQYNLLSDHEHLPFSLIWCSYVPCDLVRSLLLIQNFRHMCSYLFKGKH